MPVILETISWILKNLNVGVDRLIVGYGVRFVYSVYKSFRPVVKILLDLWRQDNTIIRLSAEDVENFRDFNYVLKMLNLESFVNGSSNLFFGLYLALTFV